MLTEGPQFQGASHGSWLWAHPLTAASTTANIGLFLRLKSQIADEVFKAPGFKDKTRRRAFQQIKYCFHNSKRSMAPAHPWHKPGKVQTFQTWRTEFHWDSDEIDDLIILSVNLKGRQLKQKFSPFETNSILARHKSDPLISLYPVLPGPEWLQVEAYYSDSFRPQLSFSNSIRHSDIEPGEEFFSFNICVTGHSDSFNICVTLFGRTISSPAHWIILELFFSLGSYSPILARRHSSCGRQQAKGQPRSHRKSGTHTSGTFKTPPKILKWSVSQTKGCSLASKRWHTPSPKWVRTSMAESTHSSDSWLTLAQERRKMGKSCSS